MGRKKTGSAAGRSLIKDRFGHKSRQKGDTFLHTSELDDGYEWGRLNLQSVTDENSLEEFLATAQLAGTEFTAEKLNMTIVNAEGGNTGLLTAEQEKCVSEAQEQNKELLKIPRRPAWDEFTTPDELDLRERNSFLEWRRQLAVLQEKEHILLTPFERNLEFWRQLWRVIERSDVVVQIVDARNPLMFRSEDLEKYVKEVNPDKLNMILINKADYLSDKQRMYWASYFNKIGMRVAFWSAVLEKERIEALKAEEERLSSHTEEDEEEDSELEEESGEDEEEESREEEEQDNRLTEQESLQSTESIGNAGGNENVSENISKSEDCDNLSSTSQENNSTQGQSDSLERTGENLSPPCEQATGEASTSDSTVLPSGGESKHLNSGKLLTGEELIDLLKTIHTGPKVTQDITTIGMVGYPNVGKSSTINAIIQTKKVAVSATPGRTKHFQTLYVDQELLLCDCPGLVMPSFVSTKAYMVVNGILPIDQMKDYVPPSALVCKLIPRKVLEATYGIILPKPQEGEDPERPPKPHEMLASYGYMRGYMTHKGVPDFPRSARCILKDYVNGKLLYCVPPPDVSNEDYEPTPMPQKQPKHRDEIPQQRLPKGAKIKGQRSYTNEVDKQFFSTNESRIGSKGVHGVVNYRRKYGNSSHVSADGQQSAHSSQTSLSEKPWKRHGNKGKKEKLRRKHSNLDVHTF